MGAFRYTSGLAYLTVLLVCGTARANSAQDAGMQTAAQNTLRTCVTALSGLQPGGTLDSTWEARTCADPALKLRDPNLMVPSVQASLIHLRPDTEEGFEVTVTSATGKAYHWPEHATLKPLPPVQDSPAYQFGVWLAAMLVLGASLLFLAFVPGGRISAVLGLGLGILGVLLLWAVVRQPIGDWPGLYIALGLMAWLVPGALGSFPRMVYQAGRERWWEVLGNSLLWSVLLSPALFISYLESARSIFQTPVRSGWTALSVFLLVVTVAWNRRRARPNDGDKPTFSQP